MSDSTSLPRTRSAFSPLPASVHTGWILLITVASVCASLAAPPTGSSKPRDLNTSMLLQPIFARRCSAQGRKDHCGGSRRRDHPTLVITFRLDARGS